MCGGLGLTLTRAGASKFGQEPRGRLAIAVKPRTPRFNGFRFNRALVRIRCNLHYSLLAMLVRNDGAWVPLPLLHLDLSGPTIEAYGLCLSRGSVCYKFDASLCARMLLTHDLRVRHTSL